MEMLFALLSILGMFVGIVGLLGFLAASFVKKMNGGKKMLSYLTAGGFALMFVSALCFRFVHDPDKAKSPKAATASVAVASKPEPSASAVAAASEPVADTKQQAASAAEYTFTPIPDIKPVWNMSAIAGKPRSVVEKTVGQPEDGDCEKNKQGETCRYAKDGAEWEITYINGVADWIYLQDSRIDNAYTSPVWLGYPDKIPTVAVPARLGWSNIPGILEMSAFTAQGRLLNIHIKVKTP